MRNWTIVAVTIALATMGAVVAPPAFAQEKEMAGKHSKEQVRKACNDAGGELLGVSDSGSYGCEVASKGTMILCNKNEKCTAYLPARTEPERAKVFGSLKLGAKPPAAVK